MDRALITSRTTGVRPVVVIVEREHAVTALPNPAR